MQTRRKFLNNAVLIAGTAIVESQQVFAATGGGIDPGTLSAKLTLPDGTVKTFSGAQGKDLGDFTVRFANIVQRNVVTKDSDGLFSVFFRPDRNDDRIEVVVLYGNPFNDAPKTHGPYTFEIFADGRSLQKTEVPYHFWLARWRWQSKPRSKVRSPSQLFEAKLVPPYGVTELSKRSLPVKVPSYTIMGRSSITPFFGQTGGRDDIAQNPEAHSAYLATGDSDCYQSMLEWAEASATGPWHINDPRTNGVINWDNWPTASTFEARFSKPKLFIMKESERDERKKFVYPDFLKPDAAHHPCLSYIPFLSTGDPFHAEELQYQINFYLGGEHNPQGPKRYIFDMEQTRGFAWMMRSVVDNILAADLIQSRTLLPKSFWKKVLENNRRFITDNFVNAPGTKARYFSSGTSKTAMGWWQEDYLCGVIGMAVQLGLREWLPVLQWKIKTDLNRINGTSGWNPGSPIVYYGQYVKQSQRGGPRNVGNGAIQLAKLSERGSQYRFVGEWQIRFTSATEYDIVAPSGGPPNGSLTKGVVGKKAYSGYVQELLVVPGSTPFAPGDVIYWTFSEIKDWKELWDVNLAMGVVEDAGPGELREADDEYMYALYAALTLAAPNIPEAASLLPGMIEKMKSNGTRLTWRTSFALPK
jgi:hypothetical protein